MVARQPAAACMSMSALIDDGGTHSRDTTVITSNGVTWGPWANKEDWSFRTAAILRSRTCGRGTRQKG